MSASRVIVSISPMLISLVTCLVARSGDAAPTKITDENYKKVSKKGLTEAEVVAVLGKANRRTKPSDGIDGMIWEDVTRVRVEFKNGVASDIKAELSKHLRSLRLNDANFKRLKMGMSEAEILKILGDNNRLSSPRDDVAVMTWERLNQIEVQFQKGIVTGFARVKSTDD